MGTTTGKLQFHDCIHTRKTGRKKKNALSRRPEYCAGEGATHREHSILKPDHFQISLVQIGYNQEDAGYESDISEQDD